MTDIPLWVAILAANEIKDPAKRAAQLFNLGVRGGQSHAQVKKMIDQIGKQAARDLHNGQVRS